MTPRTTTRWTPLLFSLPLLAAGAGSHARDGDPGGPQVPVALAWGKDGLLRVALRDARQVATVDVARAVVVRRLDLPFRPASIAALPDGDGGSFVVGGADGELLVATGGGKTTALNGPTGRGATRVVALGRGRVAAGSLWDAAVRVVEVPGGRVVRSVAVPFPVGAMVRRPGGRVVVADAFGGGLADIDPETGRVAFRVIDGVNLRALTVSGDGKELLVGHMYQYQSVPLTATNLDWGLVLSSRLSAVRFTEFDGAGRAGAAVDRRRVTLDGSRHGAADPSAVAVSPDGATVLIALSGSHQVLKNDRKLGSAVVDTTDVLPMGHHLKLETLEVGRSPADLVIDPTGATAVTADAMADTLTVVRVADLSVVATVALGRGEPARSAAQRGEAAFLDGRHAMDRWMTCASCHAAGHTSGLNFDTLGDGNYGAAKNTPSLLGVGPTAPFAWTGQFTTLADQVHQSLDSSLQGPSADDGGTAAEIAAYLETLAPPPPRRAAADPAAVRGASVFTDRGCQSCHKPETYSSPGVKNVGLDDGAGGHRAFNAPSLRGVGWTAPYFHDGRAATLDQVIDAHPPARPGSDPLTPTQRADLTAFLESL